MERDGVDGILVWKRYNMWVKIRVGGGKFMKRDEEVGED